MMTEIRMDLCLYINAVLIECIIEKDNGDLLVDQNGRAVPRRLRSLVNRHHQYLYINLSFCLHTHTHTTSWGSETAVDSPCGDLIHAVCQITCSCVVLRMQYHVHHYFVAQPVNIRNCLMKVKSNQLSMCSGHQVLGSKLIKGFLTLF